MQAAWRRLRDWLDSLQPSWLRRLVILASISAGALMIGAAIAIVGAALYSWSPSGFGASTARTTTVTTGNVVDTYETQPGKTLWDWMGLLLVPAILAGGAWWFNRQERKAERQTQEQRRPLLRQRSYGKLLWHSEKRTGPSYRLPHKTGGANRSFLLH